MQTPDFAVVIVIEDCKPQGLGQFSGIAPRVI